MLLLLSGCETMSTVDKGLYSATSGVSQRDRITGQRTLSFEDRQAQIAQGNKYIEEVLAKEKVEGRKINEALDAEAYDRLNRIFKRVHAVSHLRNEQWTPILLDRTEFNAYTTGGTYIVVFNGLMKELSDDELAAIVAHEIAHTIANHISEKQAHNVVSILTSSKSVYREGFQAAFTYDQEKEADMIGVLYAALAGYDPYAASRIWDDMFRKYGNMGARLFFQDHPVHSERSQETRRIAENVYSYYTPGKQNPNFEELLVSNALWKKQEDNYEELAGKGGGFMSALITAADTYNQHLKTKTEELRQATNSLFIQNIARSIEIIDEGPTGANTWSVIFKYSGFTNLRKITFAAEIRPLIGDPFRLVKTMDGPISYNNRFKIDFTDTNLPAYLLRSENIKVYIDDAESLY